MNRFAESHRPRATPVVVFGYNRPDLLRNCLDALSVNTEAKDTPIHVFLDGPSTDEDNRLVRECVEICSLDWGFNSFRLKTRPKNLGLRSSILLGIDEIFGSYSRAIFLEDDLIVAAGFLRFMERCLDAYETQQTVQAISGYSYFARPLVQQAYFLPTSESWGWATWKSRWASFERTSSQINFQSSFSFSRELVIASGKYREMAANQASRQIDSWAVDWFFSGHRNGQVTLYPPYTLIRNDGLTSGTHPIRGQKLLRKWSDREFPVAPSEFGLPDRDSLKLLLVVRLAYRLSGSMVKFLRALLEATVRIMRSRLTRGMRRFPK